MKQNLEEAVRLARMKARGLASITRAVLDESSEVLQKIRREQSTEPLTLFHRKVIKTKTYWTGITDVERDAVAPYASCGLAIASLEKFTGLILGKPSVDARDLISDLSDQIATCREQYDKGRLSQI